MLQSRVRYAAQSRVLGQVQQQQINSVPYNNNTATSSLRVLCSRRGIVDAYTAALIHEALLRVRRCDC